MGNKKDILPIVMASAVALVVTGIVRWMIPGGVEIKQQPLKKELSLPDIPLMIKSEQKKVREIQVLVTSADIKKDERIVQAKLSWKSWPSNAVQPYFIAQDKKGNPINNKMDYANALNMWAKSEISVGVPLTLNMLTSNDPAEVARKKKEAEDAEKAKKLNTERKKKESANVIKVGYRAVPFQLDQRTPISRNMISPGDYVDVIMNSFEGRQQKTHVYRGLKIIAIDGVTSRENVAQDKNNGGIFGTGIGFGGSSSIPKNITLEVKENLVNVMLKQAGSNGITITIRSQDEEIESSDEEGVAEEEFVEENNTSGNSLIKEIWEMNRSSSAEMLKESARKRQESERNISALLHNMNSLSMQAAQKDGTKLSTESGSKYEVVSGRIVSEADKKKEEEKDEPVKIYRKLTPDEVQFYKNGKRVKGGVGSSDEIMSSGSIR